jgi:hypothetical protein
MTNNEQFINLIKRMNKSVIYERTLVTFDGDNQQPYEALVNFNDRWNGWLKPYILKDDAVKMLNDIEGLKWEIDGDGTITIGDTDGELRCYTFIPLEKVDYIECYYFGGMGWVFEKYKSNR